MVALGIARVGFLLGWQLLGCGLAAFVVRRRTPGARRNAGPSRARRAAMLLSGLGLSWLALGLAVPGQYHASDDDAAYIYLAKRLLATGGLIDPFNMRRLTSYGGDELFQALVLWASGPRSGLAIEWFFFALLSVAIVVRTVSRPLVVPVALVLGLGVLLVKPLGIWANSAPTFSGVALNLAVFCICGSMRRDHQTGRPLMLCGVLLAGLLSLRLEFVLPSAAAIVAAAFSVLPWRRAIPGLAASAGVFLVSIFGWALALARSSATPLFPLIGGNWNRSYPWSDPSIRGLGPLIHRFLDELGAARAGIILFLAAEAAVVVAVGASRRTGGSLRVPCIVLVAAIGGTVVQIMAETPSLSGGSLYDIGRYNGPDVLACLLFSLEVLWELGELSAPRSPPSVNRFGAALATLERGLPLALASVVFAFALGEWPSFYVANFSRSVTDAAAVSRGSAGFVNGWAPLAGSYRRLNAAVPAGAHLLAAVDEPGLLDFSRFSFATLDLPGATSPQPGIPLFRGERAMYAYLVALGYTGVVASSPTESGLYREALWLGTLKVGIWDNRAEARYFLAWYRVLREFRSDPRCHVVVLPRFEYVAFDGR